MSAFKYFSEVSKHIQSLLLFVTYLPVLHRTEYMELMVIHVMAKIIFLSPPPAP